MRLDTCLGGLQSFDMLTGWIHPLRHGVYYILVVRAPEGEHGFLEDMEVAAGDCTRDSVQQPFPTFSRKVLLLLAHSCKKCS